MNYNFILKTGDSTLSGSSINIYKNNQEALLVSNNYAILNNKNTGINSVLVSLNSQTLVEKTFTAINSPFGVVYSGDADFYFKTGESYYEAHFQDINLEGWSQKNIVYDNRAENQSAIGTGTARIPMQARLRGQITTNLPNFTGVNLDKLDYFLNGQKIYSGDYGFTGNSFYYNLSITGKIFAIPKKENIIETTGELAFLSGVPFIESNSNLYLNGLECLNQSWIEVSTGVRTINGYEKSKIENSIVGSTGIYL